MKKIHMIAALLAMLLPTVLWAGGGGTTTYDYSATVNVTASGNGTVYVGRTNPSSDKTKKTDTQSDSGVEDTSKTYTFYAFAEPDSGYEFTGWSDGADTPSAATSKVTVRLDTNTKSKTVNLTATFAKIVTFDGAEYVIDENGGDLATLLSTVQAGDKIIINKDVTIEKGVSLAIPSDIQVTISSGKKLTVKGSLSIHSDARLVGDGTLAHNWKTITQAADVHVPFPLGTDGVSGTGNGINTVDGTAGKYLVTSVKEENNVTGSFTCKEEFFVAVENKASGETYYSKPSTSKPVGVLCTVAREKALNWIEGVSDTIYTDCATLLTAAATPSDSVVQDNPHALRDTNRLAVLIGDAGTVTYDGSSSSSSSALGFAVDLAGGTITFSTGKQWNSHKLVRLFNGSVTISQKVMNTNFCVYNCTGTLGNTRTADYRISGAYKNGIWLYDSPKLYIYFTQVSSTSIPAQLNFCGGGTYSTTYVNFQTPDSFNKVYWGTFASGMKPTTYLYDTNKVGAEQDPKQSNAWVVYGIMPDPNAGEVKVNGEDTTLIKALANPQAGDVIVLQRDIAVESDILVSPSASNVRIDLNGWKLTGANAIINNGDLEIIDVNGNGQIDVPVINNGTLLLSSAKYNGLITLNNGFCYFLAGTFNGGVSVASSVADASSVAEIFGGSYSALTYTHGGQTENLVELCNNGYVVGNAIAQIPVAYVTSSSAASYTLSALNSTETALYTRNAARSGYSREEWITLNKLRASSAMFSGWGVDCTVTVDRRVEANDLSVTQPFPGAIDVGIAPNNSYSALFQAMRKSGLATAPWTYGSILPGGEHDGSMNFALSNKAVQNGTLCLIEMRLATGVRNSSGPKDWSYTEYVTTAERKLVLGAGTGNKAMIRPATGAATFYATLGAAMNAVADGGTVMLANDCDTALPITKVGTYTFDTMGFAHSSDISVADGLVIKSTTVADSSVKAFIPDAIATTYEVVQTVAKVGDQSFYNLTDAVAVALNSGEVVTLLADTDESVVLNKGQSLKLAIASGVTYDAASKITTTVENFVVGATAASGYTLYKVVYDGDPVQIGTETYGDLGVALSAAKSGDTVTIIADTDLSADGTVPYGATLVIGTGATLTIASGKTLWIDGDATINGAISGTYSKCTKLIYQEGENGEPFCPYADDERHNKDDEFVIKYWKTKISTLSSLSGASSHTTIQNGLGEAVYHGANASAFVCTVNKSVAVNHITGVLSSQTSALNAYNAIENMKPQMVLLTANGSVSVGSSVNIAKSVAVDCASAYSISFSGKQLCDPDRTWAQNPVTLTLINSTSATAPKVTTSRVVFINCSNTTVGQLNANGAAYMTSVHVYDSKMPSISFASGAQTMTSVGAGVCVFSGGAFSVATSANYHYYGGYYSADPSARLYDSNYVKAEKGDPNKGENANYWYIKPVLPTVYVAQVGSEQFETVQEAVNAAGNNGGTVELLLALATDGLAEPITVAAGKTVTIDLKGLAINAPNGAFINNGTLFLQDTTSSSTPGSVTTGTATGKNLIVNNGMMDITYGTYNGNILLNAETLTTHGGTFTGTLTAASGADPKEVANLRGGNFTQNVTPFLRDGYFQQGGWVGIFPAATATTTTLSGAEAAWRLTFISSADKTLYGKGREGQTSLEDLQKYAELASSLNPYLEYTPEGVAILDRVVSGGTVSFYGSANNISLPAQTLDSDVAANGSYRMLIKLLKQNVPTPYTYKQYINDVSALLIGIKSNNSNNNGTVATIELQFWHPDGSTQGEYTTAGLAPLAQARYMLGGKKAAIDRGTNRLAYDSLAEAVNAAQDGETVLIGADTSDNITVSTPRTFTIDPYGFNWTGNVNIDPAYFATIEESVSLATTGQDVPSANAKTYTISLKVAQVGDTFYANLTDAVAAANGAVVTLLAATDETITLTAEGQTFTLNKNGIAFDDAKVVTTIENGSVTVASGESGTVYTAVTSIVDASDGHKYNSVTAAIAGVPSNDISVTITANDTETVTLPQGKTLTVTTAAGVTADLTVTPGDGAFIVESAVEGGTKYESKKITVTMAEPQATVEVKKIDHGTESAVTDSAEINAAVTQLMGNHDVPRTDNTDKLDVLDKITVTPTKIVEEVVGSKTIIRSATFDVTPAYNAGQSLAEGQKLKFRLPVDAAATQLAAIVYHGAAQFGIYPVQTYNNEKFIEVESDNFSPYGYELLDGETANPVAAIGTTGYASLSAAVAAVPTDGTETTITMLAGETIAADAGITIASGKNIVLDLNGQTVQMAATSADERWLIKNEGTLTVKDSAENGKLLMSATGQASTAIRKSTIKNMGALTVESGTIELTYSGTNKEEPTAIMNDASDRATSLTVKGGTVVNSANRGMGVYLAVNDTNATVFDVQGGRVEGFGAAVRYYFDDRNLTDAKLTFNMSNGTVHGRGMYGVQGMTTSSKDWNSISFDISGGTISCAGLLNRKSVISPLQGTVSISGGTFAGDVYIYGHALEITDGDFAGSVTLHRTKESLDSASISGGQFSSGLTIAETTADNTTNPYYNAKFITGGIYGTAPEARNVVDEYAIVDNTDSSTQGDYPKTIGGAVASVTAEGNTTYYATLNDAIAAANAANVDEITILNGATESPDADWKVSDGKLVRKVYVAQIGTTKYESLAAAVAAANADDTVQLLTDVELDEAVDIAASITLDLNGKTVSISEANEDGYAISVSSGTVTITGNGAIDAGEDIALDVAGGSVTIANGTFSVIGVDDGSLTITDGTFNGGLLTVDGTTIINGGTFNDVVDVGGGAVIINNGAFTAADNVLMVTDAEGTLTVNGGTFAATPSGEGDPIVVYVEGGEANLTGGTFTGGTIATDEAETGTLTVSGGFFSALVPEEYCANGYIPTAQNSETGLYSVTQGSYYDVWVGGTRLSSVNAADVFGDGKVSYDDATKTLTLNGYTYSGTGYGDSAVYIGDMGGATFNIVVAGENSLTSTAAYGYAIRSVGTGAVTVTGSGSDPSLALTVPSAYDTGYAVSVKGTSATFKDLSMSVTGYLGIVVNGNNAAGDALTIDNCDVVFDGTAIDQAIWVFNEGGDGTVSIENGSSLTGKGAILVYGYGTSAGDANLSITDSTVSLTGATTASASGSSRHAIEVLSNVGDSVLTIDNSTVTVTASNGLHPNGNGPDGINVGSQMSANGKGLAKIDIKNGSVVTATGNANGVNLFTWGDSSNVNPCGAELSVVDSTLNASATHATGGHYGIVAYAYQKGDTSVVFENSTVNASAPASAGIYLGAGENFNANVGNLSYEAIDSDVTTSGPYGLVVSAVSEDGSNTSVLQTVDITGGKFTCNGLLFVYGDDGENTASVSMSDVTAQIGTTTATEEPVLGTVTTGELSIDSGDYTILHAADLDTFDVADGNISGGNFNEKVLEELCADGYIPTELDPVTGRYTVKQGAFVARNVNTGVGYETLYSAVAAATAGDMVTLLTNVTESLTISKNLTLTGDWTITGSTRFDAGATVTISNLTFDANGVIYAMNIAGGSTVDLQNSTVGGGQWCNIHLNNGTLTGSGVTMKGDQIVVAADGQTYTYRGETYQASDAPWGLDVTKVPGKTLNVPYMDIVREGDTDTITLSDSEQKQLTPAGSILFVSNMPEDETLTGVTLPARFSSYTLTLDADVQFFGGADKPVTGWAVGNWNEIIDTGAVVLQALDENPAEVPVELELNNDVDLGDGDSGFEFRYPNLTIDGNGNAVSGTIKYTDNAGIVSNVVLGTESSPIVLDMTGVTKPIEIGSSVVVSNVTVQMTAEQATAGTPVIIWDAEGGVDAPANEDGVAVALVDGEGNPTGDTADLIWDDEMGMAYIGPVEARLTGPTHETPIYTTLANAIAWAEQTGDTVTLLMNVSNVTGTITIDKSLTLDGGSNTVSAAAVPADGHRNMVDAFMGGTSMLKIEGEVTLRNITLDGDATHRYTYLVSADNSSAKLTTSNVRLLNGGELAGDANGAILEQGAGYGAGIHLNNGAQLVVSNGFYACTGGPDDGVFPFTGILPEGGSSVSFELTGNPNDPANVDIGSDLLLVGMVGVIPLDQVQGVLDYMKVPSRFIPYTLTLGDGSAYAFTGASPRTWNDIIDYGKEIMDVSTAIGYQGLDKSSTPVEVGLLTDTVLPDTFRFADTNFTVNGNGNALSGTIEYTDNAGQIHDIVMGTEGNALVLDMTDTTKPIVIGSGISVSNVTIQMTAEQATAGTPVIIWDAAHGVDAPENEAGVSVVLVNDQGQPTSDTAELIWDDEMGMAYIGPCEARLTGLTHDKPIYTSLANAIELAAQSGDTITLLMDIVESPTISKSLTLNGGYTLTGVTKVTGGAEVAISNVMFDAAGNLYALDIAGGAAVAVTNATFGGGIWCNVHLNGGSLTGEGVTMLGDTIAVAADGQSYTYRGETLTDSLWGLDLSQLAGQTLNLPFMDIVRESGADVVDLADTQETPLVQSGSILYVANMPGDATLTDVTLPARFASYTLTIDANIGFLGDGTTPTTGWTLGEWNEIIDTGSAVLDAIGEDSAAVPVTLTLNDDVTVIPGTFVFRNENLTVDGDGHALAGTIEYTDNAGILTDVALGTEETPLVLDLTGVTDPVQLGDNIDIENVEVVLTPEQAQTGHVIFQWDDDVTPPTGTDDVIVHVAGSDEPVELIWDEVEDIAYVGPGVDLDSYAGISEDTAKLISTWIHIYSNQRYFMEEAEFAAGNTIPETKGVSAYIFNDKTLVADESVDYQLGVSAIQSDSATQIRVKIRLLVKGVPFNGKINGVINLLGKETVAGDYAPLDGQKKSGVTFTNGDSEELTFTVPSAYQVFNPVITLE